MNKLLLFLLLLSLIIGGCSHQPISYKETDNNLQDVGETTSSIDKTYKLEWLSDELIDMQLQAQQYADEKTKYMTSDEKKLYYSKYYSEKLENIDFPIDKEIQIRGVYHGQSVGVLNNDVDGCSLIAGFDVDYEEDNEYSILKCFFVSNDANVFWSNGETVLFKAYINKYGQIYNAESISPKSETPYENNVSQLYWEYIDMAEKLGSVFDVPEWVMGYVDTEIAIIDDETKKQLEEILYCDIYDYNTNCYIVTSGDDDATFFILTNGDYFNQGDCVGFSCAIELVPIENAGIFVGTIYEFDKKYVYEAE